MYRKKLNSLFDKNFSIKKVMEAYLFPQNGIRLEKRVRASWTMRVTLILYEATWIAAAL